MEEVIEGDEEVKEEEDEEEKAEDDEGEETEAGKRKGKGYRGETER